jgi:hypothetical protein
MSENMRTVSPHSTVPMSKGTQRLYPKGYFKKKKSLRGQGLKQLIREGKVGPRGGIRYQRKLKPFRVDKKIPRSTTVTIDQDLGKARQITQLKANGFQEETRTIPKKESGEWLTFWNHGGLKFKKNIVTGKIYMYLNDKFACEIPLGVLFTFMERIGENIDAMTMTIGDIKKGHKYFRMSVRSRSSWERRMKILGKM